MSSRIPLARPTIGAPEQEAQARALASGRLVLGPENVAFEQATARVAQCPHGVAVASGTAALHAALWALDLPPGEDAEVIVPGFTFPAPAHAVAAMGLTPIAVDVDPSTWNLSVEQVARRISPRTRAIIAVDQFGLPADYALLARLAADAKLPIIEDAACALGAVAAGQAAGSFGVLGCFSFHPRKVVTCGEGGVVVGKDAELVEKVRQLRHHGQRGPGDFARVGLNFRLAEPLAAVGAAQVARLEGLLAERRARVKAYQAALDDAPVTRELPEQADTPGRAWQTFAVVLPPGVDRGKVIAQMAEKGVETQVATYALHRVGSLAGLLSSSATAAELPVSERLHEHALALPLYGGMTDDDVARVVSALVDALS